MRSHEVGPAPTDRDAASGWEVARPLGGTLLPGVRMAGFRDRVAAGLDLHVLPQPAVIVVLGLGDAQLTVEAPTARQPLDGLVAALSPATECCGHHPPVIARLSLLVCHRSCHRSSVTAR